jgi:LPS O-antigen subunit length determinant protein (WzzB/FepE family)
MTGLSEIKLVIAKLLQDETKKLTLIEANQAYVFDYIDPPAVMEQKSEPRRAIICIIIALLGGILSVVLVLIKHYVLGKKIS